MARDLGHHGNAREALTMFQDRFKVMEDACKQLGQANDVLNAQLEARKELAAGREHTRGRKPKPIADLQSSKQIKKRLRQENPTAGHMTITSFLRPVPTATAAVTTTAPATVATEGTHAEAHPTSVPTTSEHSSAQAGFGEVEAANLAHACAA